MKIVLTGKMSKTRIDMWGTFMKLGITVQKVVSGKTDYLIEGNNPGFIKLEAANEKDVPIISENKFWELLRTKYPEYLI